MARRRPWVLCLDQGGHASRALVFDGEGRVRAEAEQLIATRRRGTDRVEHSPAALVRSLREAAGVALGQLPDHGARIGTAALATQRSSIVCWDRPSGRALSPVLSWQDRRAARHVLALARHERRVRSMTGLVLSPHYGASKIAWCLEHLPAVKRAEGVGRLAAGPLASFLLANLLEERPCLTDPVNGSRTQLLDLSRREWSPWLCDLFGVPREILPDCVTNRHPFGHLSICNLRIPLTVVTGDQPAALFALGRPRADTAYANLGTGAFMQCLSGRDAPRLLHGLVWQTPRRSMHVLEATVNGADAALQEVAAHLGVAPAHRLTLLEQGLEAEQEPPLFLNGIGGLGAPYWRPGFRSRFIGRGDAALHLAAVLESVAFLLVVNLERMQHAGIHVRRIVATGGLARNDILCQRLADLTGLPLERPELHEATALGLARLAGLRPARVPGSQRFLPRNDPRLERRYRRWKQALEAALR